MHKYLDLLYDGYGDGDGEARGSRNFEGFGSGFGSSYGSRTGHGFGQGHGNGEGDQWLRGDSPGFEGPEL